MQRTTFRLAALFTSVAALSTLGCGVPDVDPASAVGVQRAALSGVDVAWRRVGKPLYATSIAACAEGDGRLYALNSDRTIWVNRSGGTDSGWSLIIKDNFAHQVLCANNMLYVVNDDRTLWRNDGTDAKVSWTYIGRPGGAKLVTGTTALALFVPYGVIYALNDDNSLWKSTSGSDGSWQYVGRPGLAARIAAGGSELEAKPFALNTDGTLWLSGGDGCDGYWHQITDKLAAQEITAASAFKLYALDYDKTLWVGTVTGADNLTSVRSDGQPQHCDGHTLVTNRCGEDNQNCCANASCNGGYACGGGNTCEPCGGLGQLACAGGVCNDHDWQPGAGGRCEHCGSTHERACGGTRCNEVHRAPDKDGKCEFDHWCGGEGQQCCEATEFGGNCNSGMNCVFRLFDPNVCRRPVPGGGGGGGGISLCTGNQNPRDFCATVTCLSGYYDTERATACTQDSADLIIANRHTDCRVEPIHCP